VRHRRVQLRVRGECFRLRSYGTRGEHVSAKQVSEHLVPLGVVGAVFGRGSRVARSELRVWRSNHGDAMSLTVCQGRRSVSGSGLALPCALENST
jgi:hypothetical protein